MHGMTAYFVRRLLLVPVTFVAITFLVYAIQRLTPGGAALICSTVNVKAVTVHLL